MVVAVMVDTNTTKYVDYTLGFTYCFEVTSVKAVEVYTGHASIFAKDNENANLLQFKACHK